MLFPTFLLAGRQLGSIHRWPDTQQRGVREDDKKAAPPLTSWEVSYVFLNLLKPVLTSISRGNHSHTSAGGIPLRRKEVWIQQD